MTKTSDIPVLLPDPSPRTGWQSLGLLRRPLSSYALIIILGLALLGVGTASRLQHMVETEVGHRATTVLEAMLNRHAGALAADALSPELLAIIDSYFQESAASLGISEMKIWNAKGTILYASRPGLTGAVFPVSPELGTALAGEISVSIGSAFHAETDLSDAMTDPRMFEVYVPIRRHASDRVVAVAEYYQNAAVASDALVRARWQTWMMIAVVGAMFVAVLLVILRHSDAVIVQQRRDLSARMADLVRLVERNKQTQSQIQQDARRRQEEQKAQLRQINADIHDGIGQLLTVALLRMKPAEPLAPTPDDSTQSVRLILEEAMSEVQALLSGTSQTPLPQLPLARAVATIVEAHSRRTATPVLVLMDDDLPEPGLPVKVAICRLVQEGLHNAFKHAGGQGQQVRLQMERGRLVVAVSNDSDQRQDAPRDPSRQPMGLRNLRHRVERLGGTFRVQDQPDQRMEIRASFDTNATEVHHA